MSTAIRFENVSKAYRLGESRRSLREAISGLGRTLMSRDSDSERSILWALRDVSFNVAPGEVFGIIGPNGAGKTTILKLLSKITQPTSGCITVSGRTSALIELGAGFHPELTGRENIYLNGAILGLSRKEVERRFDSIVEFSGLERFIDTPVKRYSSGMYVRLGFSVAAHVEPDVLLVDEVLAVGDAQFRQRCTQRIEELQYMGTTIIFVSHNLYLVESVCDRAIFLADGRIQARGGVIEAINAYEAWMRQAQIKNALEVPPNNGDLASSSTVVVTKVEVQGLENSQTEELDHTDGAEVRVYYQASEPVVRPDVYIKIIRADGTTCCMIRSSDYGYALDDLEGDGVISLVINPLQLTPGSYVVDAELVSGASGWVVLGQRYSQWFQVAGSSVGYEGIFVPKVAWVRAKHATQGGAFSR